MQDQDKLDCSQISEMLSAFRDMELELTEVEIVEGHLAKCDKCSQELESIEMVVASLKSLPDLPGRDFADAIEARINAAAQKVETVEPVPQQPVKPQPLVSLGRDNVLPFVAPSRRSSNKLRSTMLAAAAVMLFGLVAAASLAPAPRPVDNVHVPTVANASAQLHDRRLDGDKSGAPLSEDIVALYDEEGGSNVTDAGISTNEDGLYAIKM